jgi:hypothetical protein
MGSKFDPPVLPPPGGPVPAVPFPGRAEVMALAAVETGTEPPERDAHVLAWLDAGRLEVNWRTIRVRERLHVAVSADAVMFGGVRVCCSMVAAQAIADRHFALLPTAGIVRAIWEAAGDPNVGVRVFAQTMQPIKELQERKVFNPGGRPKAWLEHQDRIEAALAKAGRPFGTRDKHLLVTTVGKDYVQTPWLLANQGRCAIYGWQDDPRKAKPGVQGSPWPSPCDVQTADQQVMWQSPCNGGGGPHVLTFFDYASCVRLVRRDASILLDDGTFQPIDLAEVYTKHAGLVAHIPGDMTPIPVRHPRIPPRP